MSLELFNHGIGLQLCINTSNFCHAAVAIFHGYSTMIVLLALNIYILNSNKSKQENVIAYYEM
jgi:hypothetical protein